MDPAMVVATIITWIPVYMSTPRLSIRAGNPTVLKTADDREKTFNVVIILLKKNVFAELN